MMEDIVFDVLEYFFLKVGDVFVFKNFNVFIVNIKFGKKFYEKCQVILCEKVFEDEIRQKLQLLLDFEVDFIQLFSFGEELGFDINVVLFKFVNVLLMVDFILIFNIEICLLFIDCEIEIENIVMDFVLVFFFLFYWEDCRELGISVCLKFCFLFFFRSDIFLRLEDKL